MATLNELHPDEFAKAIALADSATKCIGHCYVYTISLGDSPSVCFKISRQTKSDWPYNIFHNSDYGIFMLHGDEKLTLLSSGLGMGKFRKCKVKSVGDVAAKLVKYFGGTGA